MTETIKKSRILTVARLFFLLVVIPLLLISSLVAFSIVHFGGMSRSGAVLALDQKSQEEIKVRAVDLGQNIADFLRERQKDALIATIIPTTADAYQDFLTTKTGALWVKTDQGIVKEQLPLYSEMSFIDKDGREIIKIRDGKKVPDSALVNVIDPADTTYKSEEYFLKARSLDKGQVYMSRMTGWYVDKNEYEHGKRFRGIVRMATPLFDKQGFIGVVSLSLDARHLTRYTDNIIPTEPEYVIEADASTGNYAYMVDNRGFVIAHPLDYHITGLYPDGTQVPPLSPDSYDEMKKRGEEVLNLISIDGIEPGLTEVARDALDGKSGIKNYKFDGHTKMVAYAPIPFCSEDYPEPAGFGFVALGVDLEKFNEQAKLTSDKIEKEGRVWLATIVIILFSAMVILFSIAAILARGISRSIASEVPPDAQKPRAYDDED